MIDKTLIMNGTNLKLIWRNLRKNLTVSTINIFGLSISLAICSLIALYLNHEYSYDKLHINHESFFRLSTTFKYPNSAERITSMSSPLMGPYLTRESESLDEYLRIIVAEEDFVGRAGNAEVTLNQVYEADESFFDFFDYPLQYGSRERAFDQLSAILITKDVNEVLFRGENSVGEVLQYTYAIDQDRDTAISYTVSGVFDDLPENSHLQFDALTLFDDRQLLARDKGRAWHGVYAFTYFRANGNEDARQIEADFPQLLEKEMPNSEMVEMSLQPFKDIHLHSMHLEYDHTNGNKADASYLKILGWVALFILLISCINFANLTTALSLRRIQEVGVRKSLGASRNNVVVQFLSEALMMAVVSGGLAILWVIILRPFFQALIGKYVPLTLTSTQCLVYLGGVVMLGLLTGLAPSLEAARHSALQAFQQKKSTLSLKRPFVRNLVVLQFILAGILIVGALISHDQLSFLQNKDLGFEYEQVIELDLSSGLRSGTIREELAALPGVLEVTGSDMSMGSVDGQNGVLTRSSKTQSWENYPMSINRVRYNYFDLYDMQFVYGGSPSREGAESEREFVVNETFLEKVGWNDGDPIGREIWRAGQPEEKAGRLVGVIKDIHHNSLHHEISPICFQASEYSTFIAMKVNPSDIPAVLSQSGEVWSKYIKEKPFTYRFKDEQFAAIYAADASMGKLLVVATLLAILFSCLGLLALSSFIIRQRTKEIGIRKVLGSRVSDIVLLLSKNFLQLVGIALLSAFPIAYIVMGHWLQNFAYQVDIGVWVFALAAILMLAIAFLTVSLQSIRAAHTNPVEAINTD